MKYIPLSCVLRTDARCSAVFLEKCKVEKSSNSLVAVSSDGCKVINYGLVSCVILGRGTSVTHDAMELMASTNTSCVIASGECRSVQMLSLSPTASTKYIYRQIEILSSDSLRDSAARTLLSYRFGIPTDYGSYQRLGAEGYFMRKLYSEFSEKYGVPWSGRDYKASGGINARLNLLNSCLYGIAASVIHSVGMSPYIGFIHRGSPLPFVYDLSDCVKKDLVIDTAFSAEHRRLDCKPMVDEFIGKCDKSRVTAVLSGIALWILV